MFEDEPGVNMGTPGIVVQFPLLLPQYLLVFKFGFVFVQICLQSEHTP
jgi:hypothetical protein